MENRKEFCCDDLYIAAHDGRVEWRKYKVTIPMLLPQSFAYQAAEDGQLPTDPKKTTVYTNITVPFCPFCWVVLDDFAIIDRQLSLHGYKRELPYEEKNIPVFKQGVK
jgi:hypothetical protein